MDEELDVNTTVILNQPERISVRAVPHRSFDELLADDKVRVIRCPVADVRSAPGAT